MEVVFNGVVGAAVVAVGVVTTENNNNQISNCVVLKICLPSYIQYVLCNSHSQNSTFNDWSFFSKFLCGNDLSYQLL